MYVHTYVQYWYVSTVRICVCTYMCQCATLAHTVLRMHVYHAGGLPHLACI